MIKRKVWTLIVSAILILGCIWFTFYYANGAHKDTVKFQNGTVYRGTTENGKLHSGIIHFTNGDTYTGAFKNGHFEGLGTYNSHEGWTFKGKFHNGLAQGKGKLVKKQKVIQSGNYNKGVYVKE